MNSPTARRERTAVSGFRERIERIGVAARAGSTVMLQAGSEYNFTGSLVVNRALTLKGYGAMIR